MLQEGTENEKFFKTLIMMCETPDFSAKTDRNNL